MNEKEKIKKQIEATEENLKYFKSRVKDNEDLKSELEAELKELEKQENQDWKPQMDEDYYYVDLDSMEVYCKTWKNNSIANTRLQHKVIFKTREEAEEYLEYLKAKEKVMNEFSNEEWEDKDIRKYCIHYDYEDEKFDISYNFNIRRINVLFFRTEELAQEFINKYEKFMKRELGI